MDIFTIRMFLKEYRPCDLAGSSWSTSFVSWIYNYLCNHYLSPLKMYPMQHNVIKFVSDFFFFFFSFFFCNFHFLQTVTCGRTWSSPRTPVSFTNETDRHGIAEILLKVALNTITMTLWSSHVVFSPSFHAYRLIQSN